MARIAGVNLPLNKRVEIGLTYVHGVGRSTANELLAKTKIDPNTYVKDLTEDEHLDIVRRKTAYLFAGCARIGGMLGPTTREQQEALWDYGLNIGMAFQIVDDLLDFTGEEVALGKPVGGDLREGKMTLPVIHMRERGGPRAESVLRKAIDARDPNVSGAIRDPFTQDGLRNDPRFQDLVRRTRLPL